MREKMRDRRYSCSNNNNIKTHTRTSGWFLARAALAAANAALVSQ